MNLRRTKSHDLARRPLTQVQVSWKLADGLQHRAIKPGKYARFLLTGPYSQIWPAFDRMFKTLADKNVELRPEFCIENYLNDPRYTPEEKLQTELLIPISEGQLLSSSR